ncbi:SRPBCC family protein [Streptomyces sp. NPDC001553]|uniref:SRPBCC family protein n=1 Tax=Streptomyces sp. NPDC001553 TaxID=3154385 RepID=UPI0033229DF8
MGDYDTSIIVTVPAATLFSYLTDVRNLPAYMPRLTSAKPHDGDKVTVTAHMEPPGEPEQDVKSEAWINVLEEGKSLEWGAPGPHDYRGRLHVAAGDDENHSRLSVELHNRAGRRPADRRRTHGSPGGHQIRRRGGRSPTVAGPRHHLAGRSARCSLRPPKNRQPHPVGRRRVGARMRAAVGWVTVEVQPSSRGAP